MRSSPQTPMERALELARSVLGTTSPNPAVGCVIVKDGEVVGEGATRPPGEPHAERAALDEAGSRARGAVMYVSLEPCVHHGRTPPCTDAIIAAGVGEVHMATLDPNPLVAGEGRARLDAAGVATVVGQQEGPARRLNEAFFKWVGARTPFVYAKFAVSLDGKTATRTGDSRWISGEESRRWVHRMRSIVDAVMVGANTVRLDDPQLTARGDDDRPCRRQPLRVVVDSRARTAPTARMLREPGPSLVAVTPAADRSARDALARAGAEVVEMPETGGLVDLRALLRHLGQRDVTSVMVEGGGELLASLIQQRLVDKVLAFVAPVIIGGRDAPSPVQGLGVEALEQALRLREVATQRLGDDILITGYVGG
ncbi:MAG: bifunctional diaminohydroxyphosphoribosylaminopyrimidine deaminase/5-amino-6-(5-phosphoribosylamino)uracil reductase RibD [Dehalococcoidia bacterium]